MHADAGHLLLVTYCWSPAAGHPLPICRAPLKYIANMNSLESQENKNDAERSRRVGNIREFVYTVYDYYPNSNLPEHVMRRLVCPGPGETCDYAARTHDLSCAA